jgi:hypothetical protein
MPEARPFRQLAILTLAGLSAGLVQLAAFAQQSDTKPLDDLFTSFYQDPRPERLLGFVDRWQSASSKDNWVTYPPLAGFLAMVFRDHPDWIEKVVPAKPSPKTATTLMAALNLVGNPAIPSELRSRILASGSDESLKVQFAGLPNRIEDLHITTPTHLDILWGAAFASGDKQFVLMIIDFLAKTADQSEPVAIDVAKETLAYMGGPNDIRTTLRTKYGDDTARQIIYASVALWALTVNSKKHAFVRETIEKYIADNSGTPTTKALSTLQHFRGKE